MKKRHHFCGFECVFSRNEDIKSFLCHLTIDFKNHLFFVADSDILLEGQLGQLPDRFSPEYFRDTMTAFDTVILYLILHIYPEKSTEVKIDTYKDYVCSDCELLLLVHDSAYMDVYCKHSVLLNTLFNLAKTIKGVKVEKKYEDCDQRKRMYV